MSEFTFVTGGLSLVIVVVFATIGVIQLVGAIIQFIDTKRKP